MMQPMSRWRAPARRILDTATRPLDERGGGDLLPLAFDQNPVAMTLVDVERSGQPLIAVNAAFSVLTGYAAHECLGRNCRFLQGPRTDPAAVETIALAVAQSRAMQVEILNYRRDGTPFWNALRVSPVRSEDGRVRAYVATQHDMTELHLAREAETRAHLQAREVTHRIKNAFQAIESMVKLSARGAMMPQLVDKIATRVRAISNAHATALAQPGDAAVSVVAVVRDVLDPYQGASGGRIAIEGRGVRVFPGTVSVLALVLNELAVNAQRHGALSRSQGHVRLSWTTGRADLDETTEVAFDWIEHDGPTLMRVPASGEGTETIDLLLRAAGGRIAREWRPEGLAVRVILPRER